MYKIHFFICTCLLFIIISCLGINITPKYFDFQRSLFSVQIILNENNSKPENDGLVREIQENDIIETITLVSSVEIIKFYQEKYPKLKSNLLDIDVLPNILKINITPQFSKPDIVESWVELIKFEQKDLIKSVRYDATLLEKIYAQEQVYAPLFLIIFIFLLTLSLIALVFAFSNYSLYIQYFSHLTLLAIEKIRNRTTDKTSLYINTMMRKLKNSTIEFTIFQSIFFLLVIYFFWLILSSPTIQSYMESFLFYFIIGISAYLVLIATYYLIVRFVFIDPYIKSLGDENQE